MGHICYFQQVNKEEYPSVAKTNNFSRKICDNLHVKWSIITSFEEENICTGYQRQTQKSRKPGTCLLVAPALTRALRNSLFEGKKDFLHHH